MVSSDLSFLLDPTNLLEANNVTGEVFNTALKSNTSTSWTNFVSDEEFSNDVSLSLNTDVDLVTQELIFAPDYTLGDTLNLSWRV